MCTCKCCGCFNGDAVDNKVSIHVTGKSSTCWGSWSRCYYILLSHSIKVLMGLKTLSCDWSEVSTEGIRHRAARSPRPVPHLGWAALLLRARGLGYLRRGLRESSAFQTSHSSSALKPLSAAPARLTHGAAHRPFLGSPAAAPGRGGSPSRAGPAPDVATGRSRARHSSAPRARCLPQPPLRPDPLPAAVPCPRHFLEARGAAGPARRSSSLPGAPARGPPLRPHLAQQPLPVALAAVGAHGSGGPRRRWAASPGPAFAEQPAGEAGTTATSAGPPCPPNAAGTARPSCRRSRAAGQSGGARAAPAEGCAGASGVRVPEKGPPLLTCASCMTTRHCCHPRPWTGRLP